MAEMNETQKRILEAARRRKQKAEAAQKVEQEQSRLAVPTERLRTAGQGLTFGFGDEIEAGIRAPFSDKSYDEIVLGIRGGLEDYQKARPMEALAYEVGGAAIPALFPGGQGSLLRAGARAALEGAAYGMGTGEGGITDRLSNVPASAMGGAAGGAVGYGGAKALSGITSKLLDTARRAVGSRGSTVVENEIQRLVRQTGKTANEITQDIIDGRLLAENKTIQAAVRALRAQGGDASTVIQQGLESRPAVTREAAMGELRGSLGGGGSASQAAQRRASEEATVAAERQAYSGFTGQEAPQEVVEGLQDALVRVPSAAKEVEIQYRAETGKSPFFQVGEDGVVSFDRPPTVAEAESIRRAISSRANRFYAKGMGGAGGAVKGVEQELRQTLDTRLPELATVRAQAAGVRANRDAYTAGQKALTGDVNEKLADFVSLQSPEAVEAFRAGLMQALEAKAATGSRQSMIRNLTNPDTKEGKLLNEVFPQDRLDDALRSLSIASDAQEAASKVLIGTGSPTAETGLEIARQLGNINPSEISGALGGSVVDSVSVVKKIMNRLVRTQLTDAERTRIAKILVSSDPQLVRNAIQDQSGMALLTSRINQIVSSLQNPARGAGTNVGAQGGGLLDER